MRYPVAISIIMPCYNESSYINAAIDSIIGQSFRNWELIIVDDASLDDTVQLIKTYQDSRIRLFCLKNNIGNYGARNFGLTKSRGKYVAMFDADDISLPDRLAVQYHYLESHRHVGCIGSNYRLIDHDGELVGKVTVNCSYSQFKLKMLLNNYMLQSSILVRRYLLSKHQIQYDEKFRYASDYHFVFQCSKYFHIHNIADTLVHYRLTPTGITKTKFLEQQQFAARIRLEVFQHYFSAILSAGDLEIIDSVFNRYGRGTTHFKIDDIQALFNRLLDYNYKEGFFNKKDLYELLYKVSIAYLIRIKDE
jgi:glycosyltransferase involved in cell wall biosynthesis